MDETIILFDKISVSAGARGTQLILSPDDYLRAAQAQTARSGQDAPTCTKDADPSDSSPKERRLMTRALWTHLAKDLRIEWRSLDAIISMLFFSLLVVVLFSIAFDPRGAFSQQIAGGVLAWPPCSPRSARSIRPGRAKSAIRFSTRSAWRPAPGAELFLAKVMANFLFVTIVQVILAPVLFHLL